MYELRRYQTEAVNNLRSRILSGSRRLVLHAPTGSGKTICAAELLRSATEKGKRSLFLAPRRELVYQCSEKLDALGVRHGLIMAGTMPDSGAPVQVASVMTLHSRAMRRAKIPLPVADLVILDECHLHLAPSHQAIARTYADEGAVIIGLTATPARGDGRGLGELFNEIVPTVSVAELVKLGYLVPQEYYSPTDPDLAGVKVVRGDYHEGQLAEAMDKPKLVGDVVTNWLRLASDRQTVVFASGVDHSIHLRDEFLAAGITAEHLDGTTPLEERADILRWVSDGTTQVLTNCMVCTFGWDCPPVSCCVLARPTKSLILYLQMAGRVLRPHPSKVNALILDHSGVVQRLGFVDDEQPWSLDGKEKVQQRKKDAPKKSEPFVCPKCSLTFRMSRVCPKCGWAPAPREGKWKAARDADLAKVTRDGVKKRKWTSEDKQRWYSELAWYARQHGYKSGWVAHKYREKIGVWPRCIQESETRPPSPEVLSWIRSRQIAYAHQKRS